MAKKAAQSSVLSSASKRKTSTKKPKRVAKHAKVAGTRFLVIVESPTKAKTIQKYLGPGYTVKASVGHVKDLPKSKLSVDVDNHFKPHYEMIRGKQKVLKDIKDAARHVEAIYLAPDPDREGEAIAWHIAEELGKKHAHHTYRIAFNEITKKAVTDAILRPQPLNQLKFESQQARRILDRIVGYQISPVLWDKVRRGLSAGRVQSVAARLIVEREAQITAFVAEEYWRITCKLSAKLPPEFTAMVIKEDGKKFRPTSANDANCAANILCRATFSVASVVQKERKRRPYPPLITSKLQQEAGNRFGYTAKRTMMLAQQLYEGVDLGQEGSVALITYMRTDSTRISPDALVAVRDYITKQYGAVYMPPEPIFYKSKKSAQDAHEAIRPTSMDYPPERVKGFLSTEQFKLYQLIWSCFVASQMMPAIYYQTSIDITASQFLLRATGSILQFTGFLAAYGVALTQEKEQDQDDDDEMTKNATLPVLAAGDLLQCYTVHPEQHFTQAPARFSESALVKELEEKGIGRPSTYATILSTIVTRGYVTKLEGRFYPTELGALVIDLLITSFPHILDVTFTANMEDKLDDVETGNVHWVALLHDFYFGGFKESLEQAKQSMRNIKLEEIITTHLCKQCASPMLIKWGRNGSFLACKNYPACRHTCDYKRDLQGHIMLVPEVLTHEQCSLCNKPMLVKRGRYGQFLACSAYPACTCTKPLSIGVQCPQTCGGYIAERRSKRGRVFYGCSSYPQCTFAAWDRPVPSPCPTCGSAYLIRKISKRDGVLIKCPVKTCSYQRDPELDDADAHVLAAV